MESNILIQDTNYMEIIKNKKINELKDRDIHLILEGDWGGQIYLSVPVDKINCDIDDINKVLQLLDQIAWKINEGEGASYYFAKFNHVEDSGIIPGGMKGGQYNDNLWLQEEFNSDVMNQVIKLRKIQP